MAVVNFDQLHRNEGVYSNDAVCADAAAAMHAAQSIDGTR